jgi:hypothetical protein
MIVRFDLICDIIKVHGGELKVEAKASEYLES